MSRRQSRSDSIVPGSVEDRSIRGFLLRHNISKPTYYRLPPEVRAALETVYGPQIEVLIDALDQGKIDVAKVVLRQDDVTGNFKEYNAKEIREKLRDVPSRRGPFGAWWILPPEILGEGKEPFR